MSASGICKVRLTEPVIRFHGDLHQAFLFTSLQIGDRKPCIKARM